MQEGPAAGLHPLARPRDVVKVNVLVTSLTARGCLQAHITGNLRPITARTYELQMSHATVIRHSHRSTAVGVSISVNDLAATTNRQPSTGAAASDAAHLPGALLLMPCRCWTGRLALAFTL